MLTYSVLSEGEGFICLSHLFVHCVTSVRVGSQHYIHV